MKYFLNTKNHQFVKNGIPTIDLISIAIVTGDDKFFYAINGDMDFDAAWANTDIKENILMPLLKDMQTDDTDTGNPFNDLKGLIAVHGLSKSQIAMKLQIFIASSIDKNPIEFFGYYASRDWVVFNWLLNETMFPDAYPKYCKDIKQMLDDKISGTPFYENETAGIIDAWFGWEKLDEALALIETYDNYPVKAQEYNSLADAMWNKDLLSFIIQIGA